MRRPWWLANLVLLLFTSGVLAAGERLELKGQLVQGGMVIGRTMPGAQVRFDGRDVRVADNGEFVIGFGRDAREHMLLEIRYPDAQVSRRRLTVRQRRYPIQRISGLSAQQVTPGKAELVRIRREAAQIRQARSANSTRTDFDGTWIWPVSGTITGVYGSQRILNGKPRSPHRGVDIAAPAGTPVRAPIDGAVSFAEQGLFFSGGTVILDHGHGISTTYVHLRRILVHTGQAVQKGQSLGEVGASGRATGPNLHWGLNWFDRRLDPSLLVPSMAEMRSKR
ncbi:Peptidase M23B [Nitrococcus mobilis Nb-231]|uniref:Peptidase M23B n=1 Tax=Nitrococcus mobilis Nb-231 TaxID=314278 RepID=A4BQ45_9GAMM|nr:Peptidase M23B [Nitrococcus mobilis Nb-231]